MKVAISTGSKDSEETKTMTMSLIEFKIFTDDVHKMEELIAK